MEFGISKYSVLNMKRRKKTVCRGIFLPPGESNTNGYTYLGNLELDVMLHTEMTEKIKETYLKSLKLILKFNLNARSLVIVTNVWTVAGSRYSAYIKWTKKEII